MENVMDYENIDLKKAGRILKWRMDMAGYSVKDIQEFLHLSCPQTIYRWLSGKVLPSINHLYMLSKLFGVHMEDLLVEKPKRFADVVIYIELRNINAHKSRVKTGILAVSKRMA